MPICKVRLCKQPVIHIMKDTQAPLKYYRNPKDKLISVVVQPMIYSAYCYYHHKIAIGLISGGLNV